MFSPSFFSELNVPFMRDYRGQIPLGRLGNIPVNWGCPIHSMAADSLAFSRLGSG